MYNNICHVAMQYYRTSEGPLMDIYRIPLYTFIAQPRSHANPAPLACPVRAIYKSCMGMSLHWVEAKCLKHYNSLSNNVVLLKL